ncbi:hypothetical protein FOCC_FOCC008363 [Frankliniella occidentalis]|nr:hypothetical protein FOCC_FOCC008363 [Frankliniella occidentalis]
MRWAERTELRWELGSFVPLSSEDDHAGAMGPGPGVTALADSDVECQLCHKGLPGFPALAEHMEKAHPQVMGGDAPGALPGVHGVHLNGGVAVSGGPESPPQGSAGAASPPLTPTPSSASSNGGAFAVRHFVKGMGMPGGAQLAHACAQCNSSFATRDQLEKHELVHSPNIQVGLIPVVAATVRS